MKKTPFKILAASILVAVCSQLNAQTVTVDNYFNNEYRKDANGKQEKFHYLWNDTTMPGFSIFGDIFKKNGAKTLNTLTTAPTAASLKNTSVYIVVDPDNEKETAKPNLITKKDAQAIAKWVKQGGVLFLMGNDKNNFNLASTNVLANAFGLSFNEDLILHVVGDEHFDDGGLSVGEPLFKTAKTVFIKDAASITAPAKANVFLKDNDGKNVVVSVSYGKGKVLAVGDPWLYNEYVNGRLPNKFENDKAASDIAVWLLANAKKTK